MIGNDFVKDTFEKRLDRIPRTVRAKEQRMTVASIFLWGSITILKSCHMVVLAR